MALLHHLMSKLNTLSTLANYRAPLINRISTSSAYKYATKQTVEEKLGIKPRPKKPLTPFLRYLSENRTNVLKEHPEASQKDVVRILAESWKKADKSVKQPLEEIYQKERTRYFEACQEYEKNVLTPNTREEIAKEKEKIRTIKEKKAIKKKKEELGCPKKPGSSYVYFMKSKLEERGNTPFIEFQKQIKVEWNNLSETERSKYDKQYQAALETYKTDLEQWKKEITEKGLLDDDILPKTKKTKHKDAPKRPGQPFTYYQKARVPFRGDTPAREFQKMIAREWEEMSPHEKKKYEDMYQNDLADYKEKLAAWGKQRESKAGVHKK